MRKMPCLFEREFYGRGRSFKLLETVTPGCEWVLNGEGTATRKRDGTACLVDHGKLFKRYDAKAGKTPPPGAIPCDPQPDPETGHWPHWVPVGDEPDSKWHLAAWEAVGVCGLPYGSAATYELCGPHFSPNEELGEDDFYLHGAEVLSVPDRSWEGIRAFLEANKMEGIVFWRDIGDPDCQKVKIRRDDYGLPWRKKGKSA